MKKFILVFLILFWFWLAFMVLRDLKLPKPVRPTSTPTPTSTMSTTSAMVKRVVDGDTVELENKDIVRYIGINTPETVDPRRPVQCFGKEASMENKKLVEGKTVRLEKDISEKDKYGRLLRYVYIDNIFVNDYLVRNGFAQVSTFPPDVKYAEQFLKAQEEAKTNQRGLWNKCSTAKSSAFP